MMDFQPGFQPGRGSGRGIVGEDEAQRRCSPSCKARLGWMRWGWVGRVSPRTEKVAWLGFLDSGRCPAPIIRVTWSLWLQELQSSRSRPKMQATRARSPWQCGPGQPDLELRAYERSKCVYALLAAATMKAATATRLPVTWEVQPPKSSAAAAAAARENENSRLFFLTTARAL